MIIQDSVAAATAVVNYDLLKDNTNREAPYRRKLVAVGLAGSAAALDSKVDIKVGNNKVGEMYNAATGANTRDTMFRLGEIVPANVPIQLIVTDAPATNPLNPALDVVRA